jgi:16S rRNA C1402 (ribose-2'-O) methylase RsmI
VARELTKLHEEVVRGSAIEVRDRLGPRQDRGEFVLVVKGIVWRKRDRDP